MESGAQSVFHIVETNIALPAGHSLTSTPIRLLAVANEYTFDTEEER